MKRAATPAPDCVEKCLEEALDAMCEALGLARSAPLDERVAHAVRSANDLLDLIERSAAASQDFAALDEARARVNATGALFSVDTGLGTR
jgi:hypothetical protein